MAQSSPQFRAWPLALAILLLLAAATVVRAQQDTLADLVRQVRELRDANRYPEAAEIGKRVVEKAESLLTQQPGEAIAAMQEHGHTLMMLGRYAETEHIHRRALDAARAASPLHPLIPLSIVPLAGAVERQGRVQDAETLLREYVAFAERIFGSNSADVVSSVEELAELYERHARLGEAEPVRHRALALVEAAQGPHSTQTAAQLRHLAKLLLAQGRAAEAEPLLRRALVIGETAFGADYPLLASYRADLASALLSLDRAKEALPFARSAAAGMKRVLGVDHGQTAGILRTLAGIEVELGLLAEAEANFRDALKFFETRDANRHSAVGYALAGIADVKERQRHLDQALPLRQRVLSIMESAFGTTHRETADAHSALASLHFDLGNWTKAIEHYRSAAEARLRLEAYALDVAEANTRRDASLHVRQRSDDHMAIVRGLSRLAAMGMVDAEAAMREAFISAQRAAASQAASALAQMAARQAIGGGELARLVRMRQDLVAEWRDRDRLLVAAISVTNETREGQEETLRKRLADIEQQIAGMDRTLRTTYPDYAALGIPQPLTVPEAKSLLADDEALVAFLDTPEWAAAAEETFVWVITKDDARWTRIGDIGADGLAREVDALRCGLDAAAWTGAGAKRCAEVLGVTIEATEADAGKPLPFDAARAHSLYLSLFGRIANHIKGKHLLILPSGALQKLPFQVLVSEAPTGKDLSSARWLVRDHALTVLPAVSSLKALRRDGKPSAASRPMIGFGNPILEGDRRNARHVQRAATARKLQACETIPGLIRSAGTSSAHAPTELVDTRGGLARVSHLMVQPPLPETANELCEVAREMGANPRDIRLGERATEREVKMLSERGELRDFKVVHFATHAALAGRIRGTHEPGLILTPPDRASMDDDGYLTAGEIATLKLDADWAILSACNSAGPAARERSGASGTEALSGLARAFFYAGARALLVSHWEVDSAAAVKLVASAVSNLAKAPSIGRAEALRRAMLAVMADTSRPADWAPAWHPSVWAPFVLAGEGGAGR